MRAPSSACSCWISEARASQTPSPHQASCGEGIQQRRQSIYHISGIPSALGSLPHSACLNTSAGALRPLLPPLATSCSIGQECYTASKAQAVDFRHRRECTSACCHAGQTTSSGMLRWSGKPCAMIAEALACGHCWGSPLVASVRCAAYSPCHCHLLSRDRSAACVFWRLLCGAQSLQSVLLQSPISAALGPLPGPKTSSRRTQCVSAAPVKPVCIHRIVKYDAWSAFLRQRCVLQMPDAWPAHRCTT